MLDQSDQLALATGAAVKAPPVGPSLPLAVSALVLERDGKRLLDGIDLVLAGGLFTVIMGPNGAGKSLLLRLLHGLIQPTSGMVTWGGQPMGDQMRARQAMVFQRPVLLRRSVAANLDFVLRLQGDRNPGTRDGLLADVGLLKMANQPARLLSGGEQQRLALARALATGPQVLFLDEPTASLDPASTLVIERLVQRAHARGTRVIWVTHDIGQAKRLAGDVVFLNRGRVVEHAPVGRFFADPKAEVAQAFLAGRIVV